MKRVFFDTALFLSFFLFPWWITLPLVVVGLFIFKNYYEFLIYSIAIYAIFNTPSLRIISSPIWYSIFIMVLFLGVQYLKKKIIFYDL